MIMVNLVSGEVAITQAKSDKKQQIDTVYNVLESWVKSFHAGKDFKELNKRIIVRSKDQGMENIAMNILKELAEKNKNGNSGDNYKMDKTLDIEQIIKKYE